MFADDEWDWDAVDWQNVTDEQAGELTRLLSAGCGLQRAESSLARAQLRWLLVPKVSGGPLDGMPIEQAILEGYLTLDEVDWESVGRD